MFFFADFLRNVQIFVCVVTLLCYCIVNTLLPTLFGKWGIFTCSPQFGSLSIHKPLKVQYLRKGISASQLGPPHLDQKSNISSIRFSSSLNTRSTLKTQSYHFLEFGARTQWGMVKIRLLRLFTDILILNLNLIKVFKRSQNCLFAA